MVRLLAVYISSGRRCWNCKPGGRTVLESLDGFLSRRCGWLPEWFCLVRDVSYLMISFSRALVRVRENARGLRLLISLQDNCRDSYYVLSIYPCFHQNGFICMFFLAVSVLSIFFMFISLDSWYFFQPGWFTLC